MKRIVQERQMLTKEDSTQNFIINILINKDLWCELFHQ
jgi:hypothetical protein